MALTRKPKADESMVQEIIGKGGKTSADTPSKSKKITVQLRLSEAMLERIDKAVKRRAVPIPRHTWFLEAIVEKLDRDF
jgi:predicted DNA binding CopG/RHH family protein